MSRDGSRTEGLLDRIGGRRVWARSTSSPPTARGGFRADDDRLVDREIHGPSDLGGYDDGIAFDAFGNLRATLIMANRLVAITPERGGDPATLEAQDDAQAGRAVTPALMGAVAVAVTVARANAVIHRAAILGGAAKTDPARARRVNLDATLDPMAHLKATACAWNAPRHGWDTPVRDH